VGTAPENDALEQLLRRESERLETFAPLEAPAGIEVRQRWVGEQPQTWLLNHDQSRVTIALPHPMHDMLGGRDVEGDVPLEHGQAMLLVPRARERNGT
jgi:hypothetical protein